MCKLESLRGAGNSLGIYNIIWPHHLFSNGISVAAKLTIMQVSA